MKKRRKCPKCGSREIRMIGSKNPRETCIPCRRIASRKYVTKSRYGVTIDEYEHLLALQGGRCAICRTEQDETGRRLAVDHCHFTKKVRGILCSSCNFGLGKFRDSPTLLVRAIDYLLRGEKTDERD